MTDVVTTKTFKNGGSLAIRIPAGWIQDGELTLTRDPVSGEIVVSQRSKKLRELLAELATSEPIEDPVFEAALVREGTDLDISIFERQARPDAAN